MLLLSLAIILAAAAVGGHLATRLGQPPVLGELLVGVLLGNIAFSHQLAEQPGIDVLAELGVVVLLFEVGLESTVKDMMKVGLPSLLVALLGVIAPFVLGWAVGAWLLPERGVYVHAFMGAALTATSVGITARVLQDLGRSKSPEARVILGAAVVDDVLGLVVLAVVSALIKSGDVSGIPLILGKALGFLVGALVVGVWLAPKLFVWAGRSAALTAALVFCFLLSYLASTVGLAPIVGAYSAGLLLEEDAELEALIRPISRALVPVFFVVMGMRVELATFAHTDTLVLAALLTLAAVVGKQACSVGAMGRGLDAITIGIGMIPRGEVGIIFANVGHSLGVVDARLFSAMMITVIVTTVITPPALKWRTANR